MPSKLCIYNHQAPLPFPVHVSVIRSQVLTVPKGAVATSDRLTVHPRYDLHDPGLWVESHHVTQNKLLGYVRRRWS